MRLIGSAKVVSGRVTMKMAKQGEGKWVTIGGKKVRIGGEKEKKLESEQAKWNEIAAKAEAQGVRVKWINVSGGLRLPVVAPSGEEEAKWSRLPESYRYSRAAQAIEG
ncbi:unnamed protein product [marine sediment metagenome]|uniref:Uncharacterized protein n=1 Tax=marine sediment metagenome TaxID=412755 RepID=X0RS73_9ZZZZ